MLVLKDHLSCFGQERREELKIISQDHKNSPCSYDLEEISSQVDWTKPLNMVTWMTENFHRLMRRDAYIE